MADRNILAPIHTIEVVPWDSLRANDYNPNKVVEENLRLLTVSIFRNGWTLPIVTRPDGTIIDGFHRHTVAGPDWKYTPDGEAMTLFEALQGKVPRVIVEHKSEAENIYGTVTHNRARGTHLLEPMKAIVQRLIDSGKSVKEIAKELGMKPEEVFRLSNFSREDFLNMIVQNEEYGKGKLITKI